eukprot:8141656-Pyramimonas_sp.AAC.1
MARHSRIGIGSSTFHLYSPTIFQSRLMSFRGTSRNTVSRASPSPDPRTAAVLPAGGGPPSISQ